eukprot:Anaeramoba_flamelloidesa4961_16.p1 GENE.a4961_16~~a4961_16.p1  ORF type:complete len:128 (-),score=34.99 a4961_16:103-486(-)
MKKFRKNSKAKNKKNKDVSHVLGLSVVKQAQKKTRGKKPTTRTLKKNLNQKSNLRMRTRRQNRSLDARADNKLKKAIQGKRTTVTKTEAKRIKETVKKRNLAGKKIGNTIQKATKKLVLKSGKKAIN